MKRRATKTQMVPMAAATSSGTTTLGKMVPMSQTG
jgi:hypothetical protein